MYYNLAYKYKHGATILSSLALGPLPPSSYQMATSLDIRNQDRFTGRLKGLEVLIIGNRKEWGIVFSISESCINRMTLSF